MFLAQQTWNSTITVIHPPRGNVHDELESADSRRARLWQGDAIVVAYGARYAPDQCEAFAPDDLSSCHLVAAGGIAARLRNRDAGMRPATQIDPIGLLADRAGVLNVRRGALGTPAKMRPAFTVTVVGSSMNVGKPTTAANLIAGLRRLGHRVGAAKGATNGPRSAITASLVRNQRRGFAGMISKVSRQVPRSFGPAIAGYAFDNGFLMAPFVIDALFQAGYLLLCQKHFRDQVPARNTCAIVSSA